MSKIKFAFAQDGSCGVVIRYGPRRSSCMLKWDLATDSLQVGQWIKPKVQNFDLNSDGSLILCFIQSYRKKDGYSPYVTLSKPPWYTALALWKVGDSWGGLCGFSDDSSIWIQKGVEHLQLKGALKEGMAWHEISTPAERDELYRRLAERRGWKLDASQKKWVKYHPQSGFGLVTLRVSGKTCYALPMGYDSWFWRDPVTGIESTSSSVDIPSETCIDIDPRGRLVYAGADGKIYGVERHPNGEFQSRVLHDLADLKPQWIKAPMEATTW